MKDQYFGDVNDYRKYGLIRILTGRGVLRAAVCWALTESDGRTDGSRTKYLERPSDWRRYDPDLFAFLHREVVERGQRLVKSVERSGILPNCTFFGEMLPHREDDRDEFFRRLLLFASGVDVVFFDPDNGLGVKSVPRGCRNSLKYVYPSEVILAFRRGHSVLLYQHFPRQPRAQFIRAIAGEMAPLLGVERVVSFSTSNVVFLLFPQPRHWGALEESSARVSRLWRGQIEVRHHRVSRGALEPAVSFGVPPQTTEPVGAAVA